MFRESALSRALGPDGKNSLYMICASKKHFVDKCPQRMEPLQARAATLETADEDGGSPSEARSLDA